MTTSDDDDVRAALQYVDEALPTLPTAEALAQPMLESIYALHRLDQLAWSLGFIQPHHGAEYAEAATAVVKLLEETAGLIESAVRSCLTPTSLEPDRFELAEATRRLVFALADADGLRHQVYGDRAHSIVRPDV